MKTKIIQNIKSIILALILVIGVSYVSAVSTWTNPTQPAPNGNTDTPINTSNTGQIKDGGLTLNKNGATNSLILRPQYNISGILTGAAFIENNGNVGIGTTTPNRKMHVSSTINQDGITINSAKYPELRFEENGSVRGYLGVAGDAGGYFTGSLANSLVLRSENALHFVSNANANNTMTLNNGNVGIGTTNPTQKLEVAGKIKGTELCIGTDCKSSWPSTTKTNATVGTADESNDIKDLGVHRFCFLTGIEFRIFDNANGNDGNDAMKCIVYPIAGGGWQLQSADSKSQNGYVQCRATCVD